MLATRGDHLVGSDAFGLDVFSRLIFGSRTALLVGFTASLVGSTVGLFLGVVGGFVGGRLDQVIQRSMDILLSFPPIVLAIAVGAALGGGEGKLSNGIIAIPIPSNPRVAGVTRSGAPP